MQYRQTDWDVAMFSIYSVKLMLDQNQLHFKKSARHRYVKSSTFQTGTLVIKIKHKFEVWVCLMVVFRMACVDAFRISIGLNNISSPVQIVIKKNRLYLNKIVSKRNCSCASVTMCLAVWQEREFLYTSASKQRFLFSLCARGFLIVKQNSYISQSTFLDSCFVFWLQFISEWYLSFQFLIFQR